MESYSYSDILGSSSAPYLNQLASTCGLATNYVAVSHPSLPNYVALTSGSVQGITDDDEPSAHPIGAANIFSQLGGKWRVYSESMPTACDKVTSDMYAARHNPAVYYTNLGSNCKKRDLPLGATISVSSEFTMIVPNICHDMHSCSVAVGDSWLSVHLPQILSSSTYQSNSTVVFILWDEADSDARNHTAAIVIGPSVPSGLRVDRPLSHYSTLQATEALLHLPLLGNAATANSLISAFNL